MTNHAELIIIGAGPAGMTAAIYASRAGLDTLLLDSSAPGGKLLKTNEIANWPGTKASSGADLAIEMFEHSIAFGARYQYGNVVEIQQDSSGFRLTLADHSIPSFTSDSESVSDSDFNSNFDCKSDSDSGFNSGCESNSDSGFNFGCKSGPGSDFDLNCESDSDSSCKSDSDAGRSDARPDQLTADAVIVATGTKERLLNIPGEEKNIGRGVSYCAVCDGAFIRGGTAAVIGAGNSALEEADYLTQFANKVYLVMRRDVFRGDRISVEKVKNNPKIEIIQNAVPTEIKDDGTRVTGLVICHTKIDRLQTLDIQGIFPYIGADPVSGFLNNLNVLTDSGYLKTDERMRTAIPRLYGAGDVTDKVLRQVVTAANDGAIAAQQAFSDLRLH